MSEDRKLLEDENISVEYDIVNGLVCIDKIYLKEAKVVEETLTEYTYEDNDAGITLYYDNMSSEGFDLKIRGKEVYSLDIQRLIVWLSSEYVNYVDIQADNTGLEVSLPDFLENGEVFTKDFLDSFSVDIIDEILKFKNKGAVAYYVDRIYLFRKSGMVEFRKLIHYVNEALI